MQFPGLVSQGFYTSRSRIADAEKAWNLYTEAVESGQGREKFAMYSTPGRKLFATLPDFPIRALWAGENRLFAVGGGTFFEIFQDGSHHAFGSVAPGTTPAQIFASVTTSAAAEIFISSAGQGYYCDGSIIEPVVAAATATFVDGYIIAAQPNSKQFNISGFNNFASWNALDFGVKEGWPDNLSAVWSDHKFLWLLGFETSEVWYDSGAANFPFERVPGGLLQHGCVAPFSVAQVGETLMWLAGDEAGAGWVAQAQGQTPTRVSNHAVEYAIAQYAEIQDAQAYSYQDGGHFFYVLNFPTADQTWVYDLSTGQWHQRGLWDPSLGIFHRELHAACHAYAQFPTNPTVGHHYVGDAQNGNIYIQSTGYYDDAGFPKRWLRAAPHLSNQDFIMGYGRLDLLMQRGVAAQGINPQVMMRYSDDGGFTWSNERMASSGKAGQYKNRVIWRALGSGRDRVFEVSGTSPIDVALVDAYVRIGGSTDS